MAQFAQTGVLVEKSHPRATYKDHLVAFTQDANETLRPNDLHVKSMERRDRQSCGAIHVNEAANYTARIERLTRHSRELQKSELWRIFALR